jgi:hypothetical protein
VAPEVGVAKIQTSSSVTSVRVFWFAFDLPIKGEHVQILHAGLLIDVVQRPALTECDAGHGVTKVRPVRAAADEILEVVGRDRRQTDQILIPERAVAAFRNGIGHGGFPPLRSA